MEINVHFNFKLEDKLSMESEILKLCEAVSDHKEKHGLLDESLVENMAATTLEESKEWIQYNSTILFNANYLLFSYFSIFWFTFW